MKTLIISAHPNLEESVINRRWLTELRKQPDLCTIHTLAACYPDGRIDVERKHRLIEEHGSLIFQFPIYWFSCPPILKTWFDEVLTHGWLTEETAGISWRGARSRSRSQRANVRRITASTDDTTIRSRSCSPRLYGEARHARGEQIENRHLVLAANQGQRVVKSRLHDLRPLRHTASMLHKCTSKPL